MKQYELTRGNFLREPVQGYSHGSYVKRGNDDPALSHERDVSEAVRILKNTYGREQDAKLTQAKNVVQEQVRRDLDHLIARLNLEHPVVVCAPRSKADFLEKQLLFQSAVSNASQELEGVEDGAFYIKRIENTKTTHLKNTRKGDLSGDGDLPYPGITEETCDLLGDVQDKTVILVDDIYTKTVNIDEDCCQFLLDHGASDVLLYTLCKTELN